MSKKELMDKYKKIYSRIIRINQDREIFPVMDELQYEVFVSQKDWMGVPSFAITKKEMTNSDQGHVGIWDLGGKITIDLWFNGVKAVNRFINILHPFLKKEKENFIKLIRSLDEKYKIVVYYTEKYFAGSAEWEKVFEIKCNNLTDEKIEELLKIIEQTKERRDRRQKEIPKREIATMAVSLAEIEISNITDEKLSEILKKIVELTRITHQLKSLKHFKKIEKERDNDLKILRDRKKRMEIGVEEATQEEYDGILKRIEELYK